MIRLKIKVPFYKVFGFFQYYNYLQDTGTVNVYIGRQIKQFGYNYSFKFGEEKFWIGFRHNTEKATDEHTYLYLEFNPNKAMENFLLKRILNEFYWDFENVVVVSCDVAKDLRCNIANVFYDNKKKRLVKQFISDKGKTIYIGKDDGRTKIYDKAKEQGLKGIEWTRFEVSIRIEHNLYNVKSFSYNKELPSIMVAENSLFIKAEERAIIYALMDNIVELKELKRTTKNKIINIMESFKVGITINKKEITDLLVGLKEKIKLIIDNYIIEKNEVEYNPFI